MSKRSELTPSRDERAIDFYRQFREGLPQAIDLELAPYPRPFAGGEFNVRAILFHQVAQDALREIANTINDFGRYLSHLDAWTPIYEGAGEDDRSVLLLEHIRPLLTLALNAPYSIRGRIIYAACASSQHARNFTTWPGNRPDWRSDHADMRTAKRLAEPWAAWPTLAAALGRLEAEELAGATGDFRNHHHHGHPRSIGVGYVASIRRLPGDRESWSMGEEGPLSPAELIPRLVPEHAAALEAFRAYLALVIEQHEAAPFLGV